MNLRFHNSIQSLSYLYQFQSTIKLWHTHAQHLDYAMAQAALLKFKMTYHGLGVLKINANFPYVTAKYTFET